MKTIATTNFNIMTDSGEINLTVEGTFYPLIRGSRDRWGAPEEPDEAAHWDIESIRVGETEVTDFDEFCEEYGISWNSLDEICQEKLDEELSRY